MSALALLFTGGGERMLGPIDVFLVSLLAVAGFHWIEEKPRSLAVLRPYENVLLPAAAILVILLVIQFAGGPRDFFYFQF